MPDNFTRQGRGGGGKVVSGVDGLKLQLLGLDESQTNVEATKARTGDVLL